MKYKNIREPYCYRSPENNALLPEITLEGLLLLYSKQSCLGTRANRKHPYGPKPPWPQY